MDAVEPERLILQLFLQGCLKMCFASEQEFASLLERVCEAVMSVKGVEFDTVALSSVISAGNRALSLVDLELRPIHDPESGVRHWVLANNNDDIVMREATKHSVDELVGLKRLIELIMTSDRPRFLVSSIVAVREVAKARNKSNLDAEKFIKQLIQDRWIMEVAGKYTLSLRSTVELDSYLRDTFAEQVTECALCHEMCLARSKRCQNSGCGIYLHHRCINSFLVDSDGLCPSCNEPFA